MPRKADKNPETTLAALAEDAQADRHEALNRRRREMHLVISSLPHIILVVNRAQRVTSFFSPSGFPPILNTQSLAPEMPLNDILPADLQAGLEISLNTLWATGKTGLFEYTAEVEGKLITCEIKVAPIVDSRDALITMNDITLLKQAQRREQQQRLLAEALVDTATGLNTSLRLDEVLDRLLNNLAVVIPHDTSNIMLVEDGIASVVRWRGNIEELIQSVQMPVDSVPTFRLMAKTGQPLIIPDTMAAADWIPVSGSHWIAAYAAAPIIADGEILGFINLDSETPGAFTPLHEPRLEAFANQAAIALKNARLFSEVETRNHELDAFTHTVAHDLKSPLQALMSYTAILDMQIEDGQTFEAQTTLQEMQQRVRGMAGIIDGLLRLATLRDSRQAIHPVDMEPVMQAALGRFDPSVREHHVSIELAPATPPALGYGPWVEEVWANLISNAIKYTAPHTPTPHLRLCGYRLDDSIRYEVQDNGPGISEEDQAHLFEMFSRFNTNVSGHGLGLSIVQRIVNKLGGKVGVESIPGVGSTFWFTLPQVAEEA